VRSTPGVTSRGALRVINVLGPSAVLGFVAGLVWSWVAEPATWTVSDGSVVMTEFSSRDEFGVLLWYCAIGLVLSTVAGAIGAYVLRADWRDVVLLTLGAAIASLVAWQTGVLVGPPDPASVTGLQDGDVVAEQLAVTSPVGFLSWPVGALLGVLIGSAFERDDHDLATDATTAWVDEIRS